MRRLMRTGQSGSGWVYCPYTIFFISSCMESASYGRDSIAISYRMTPWDGVKDKMLE